MTSLGPLEADTCRDYIVPALEAAGWKGRFLEQFRITDGRIVATRRAHKRQRPLRADYLLEVAPGFAVAVVEAKREFRKPGDGLQQAKDYAGMLDLPFAYSSNGKAIVEHDFDSGLEQGMKGFPRPDQLWRRYAKWKGLDRPAEEIVKLPFNRTLRNPDGSVKEPRYYQRVAIERALEALLGGRSRVLLTMATGSGKTFTALQILWKLWNSGWRGSRRPRFLYLADRNLLVDQPIAREFKPVFGDAVWKLRGEIHHGRELYFALYQALGDVGDQLGIFRDLPADFFDLVIVDECHRGSARDESSWRGILEHFGVAAQLGMTATPKRDDNVDTYSYFGDPVYQYSLAQGIEDGFLAPYRVRRVVLSPDVHGWSPAPGELDRYGREIPQGLYETPEFERVVSLLERTDAAAKHLTRHLRETDPLAKTIVFCVDSEHADQMRRALNNANPDLARQYPDYVVRIVSDEGEVGRGHLGRFADTASETPVIATTSKLLSTGVDLPTVRNIVLFKPIGSIVDFKQIIGRGTRLFPDLDKLSFEIIDYTGATVLFEDSEFDGPPERVVTEEIDASGSIVAGATVEDMATELEAPVPEEPATEDLERRSRKFYVDDAEVYLVAEGVYVTDTRAGRLKLVEYADYVAQHVRRLYTDVTDLRSRWRHRAGRREVTEVLETRGISLDDLAERTGLLEADPLDILVHLAWNAPVISRRERVRRVQERRDPLLVDLAPEARQILDLLLDKYAEHGPSQLDDLRVLEVPQIARHGSVVEIARHFGGPNRLQETVADLQDLLYTA